MNHLFLKKNTNISHRAPTKCTEARFNCLWIFKPSLLFLVYNYHTPLTETCSTQSKIQSIKNVDIHVQHFSGYLLLFFFLFLLTSRLFILAIKIIPGRHFVPNLARWIPLVKRVTTVWISINRVVCYSIPQKWCHSTNLCANPWKFTFQEQRFSSADEIPAFTHCPTRVQLLKSKIT